MSMKIVLGTYTRGREARVYIEIVKSYKNVSQNKLWADKDEKHVFAKIWYGIMYT